MGSQPFSLSSQDWKKILAGAAIAAAGAVLTFIADSVLPDFQEKGLLDASLFVLFSTLVNALRKFLTDTRFLAVLALLGMSLAVPAQAEVIDTAGSKPGTYLLTVNADGSVTITGPTKLVRLKDLGGPVDPTDPVDPDPDPVLSPLAQSVRELTAQALSRGGTPDTAAKIAAIYALVSDDCSAVPPKTGMPGLAKPLITAATDKVLSTAPDKAAWTEWRKGVGVLLGAMEGIGTNAAITGKALDDVATGTQFEITRRSLIEPGILDGINWTAIREFLRPILQELLNKLIEELLKKLP